MNLMKSRIQNRSDVEIRGRFERGENTSSQLADRLAFESEKLQENARRIAAQEVESGALKNKVKFQLPPSR